MPTNAALRDALLDTWFGKLTDGFADEAHRKRWFAADAAFDAQLRERFGPALAQARGEPVPAFASVRDRLAYVLLCDQLSRNIHRGTADAFATDALALTAARQAVARGEDVQLALDERAFLYLPFEHSEDLLDQHLAVGLFVALRDDTPKAFRHLTGQSLRYAQQHRDIVRRFGRFPHRNAALGRRTTARERNFLADGNGFGQG